MDARDEVKDRLSIEEVVGDYVELKRAGSNFKALSPWTSEKTASLMVSPEKQIWHDFSSGKGGDIFSFVMEIEGLDFRQSLELLARKAGVDIEQFKSSGSNSKLKERYYEAHELAVLYYQKTLVKNPPALDYLVKERKFGKDLIRDFKFGYSPSNGQALSSFLEKKGFNPKELKDAGLVVIRNNRPQDLFRGRIMVPLSDFQGRVVGFTARQLNSDYGPKYLNTPQTLIYDKGRQVYGLHLAKEAIRKEDFVVVVEGNLDVVGSHKAGVKNVVASAGTALTKQHLISLSRLTNDIRLAFDSDKAGISATERVIPLAQEVGVKISIIQLPEGEDPDSLVQKSPEAWKKVLEKHRDAVDWIIAKYKSEVNIQTSQGKKILSDKALDVISKLQDPVETEHYLKLLASELNVRFSTIQSKLAQAMTQKSPKKRIKTTKLSEAEVRKLTASAYQDQLLGLNLLYPEVRSSLQNVEPINFDGEPRQAVARFLFDTDAKQITKVPKELHEHEDYVKIILFKTEELYEPWNSTDRMIEAIGLAQRLLREFGKKRKTSLSQKIKKAEEAGDQKEVGRLLEEFHKLLKE